MQELFRQNAYGDTWQEPELFDQPGVDVAEVPAVPPNVDLVERLHVRHDQLPTIPPALASRPHAFTS